MSHEIPMVPVVKGRSRKASNPKRSKPRDGNLWWKTHQVKNLDALSLRLSTDLEPYLPRCEDIVGDWSPIDATTSAAKQLQSSFLKKYEWETSDDANAAALAKFLQVNEACRNWRLDMSSLSERDHLLLGELKRALYKTFNRRPLDPTFTNFEVILDKAKVGPGAALGANESGFYSKLFSSKLTCTSAGLYKAYSNYVRRFPIWDEAEEIRNVLMGDYNIVPGNKLSFVPKNVDISRIICVEPSLNMYYQLGVKQILEECIKKTFGVDFSTQQMKNRDLAQLGSMFDNQWVTIDLSSASDSLSIEMMRYVLPADIFGLLEVLRSPYTTLPDGSQLKLEMISTMGNGYTFPLQTLLFLCVVWAAHRLSSLPFERPIGQSLGNFGVYGDDIICRTEVSSDVLRLLELLGFTVNSSKSFFKGPFRESCGGDFFKGHLVRGVYIDSLRSTQDAYVAVNALNRWTSATGILVPRTVRFLISMLRKQDYLSGRLLFVPLAENDDAGVKIPRSLLRKYIVDPHVQSIQYECFVPKAVHIRFTEDGRVLHPFGSQGNPSRGLVYNPPGLYIAALSGNVSGSGEGVRQRHPRYRVERRVTPCWDYIDNSASIALADPLLRLGNAIAGNTGWS